MSSPLCGTGLYANDVLCEVINELDGLQTQANAFKDLAIAALGNLGTLAGGQISGIEAVDYDGTALSGVDLDGPATWPSLDAGADSVDYSEDAPSAPTISATIEISTASGTAPEVDAFAADTFVAGTHSVGTAPAVPDEYTVPDADASLISQSVLDDIFDREGEKLARVSVKQEREDVYALSAMGIGLVSSALAKRLARAQHETNLRLSQAASDQATQEGTWRREDAKTLHGLHVQNWPQKPQLELDTFRTFEGLELDVFRTREGSAVSAYGTEQSANVQAYSTKEAQKQVAFGRQIEATQANNDAAISSYQAIAAALNQLYSNNIQWKQAQINAELTKFGRYIEQFRTEIQLEAEKRGWTELEARALLEQADKDTGYALEKARLLYQTATDTQEKIAQFYIGLTASLYSAANYNLSGSGSQSVSENVSS